MAASTQSSGFTEQLIHYKPENMAEIIGKLAGDKPNLRISIKELKLCIRNTRYEINGEINFNVVRKKPPSKASQGEIQT